MRATSGKIWDLWEAGGPFIGSEGRPNSVVTVEIGWTLGEHITPVGSFNKPPLRYVQSSLVGPTETIVPNVQLVSIERSLDQDAATLSIQLINQKHNAVGVPNINSEEFGNPGYMTFGRGTSASSLTLWGQTANEWEDVLVPNAMLRTYQGFGGHNKSLAQAISDGDLYQTGIWLVDEVNISTGGKMEIRARDTAKLLIDQILYPPLVPLMDASGCDVYPLRYARYYFLHGTQTATVYYGVGGAIETTRKVMGIEYAPISSTCRGDLEGYWLVGDDGGVYPYGYINTFGSLSGAQLSQPVVDMAVTKTNNGYWLATADGGVFAFGDAVFYGSLPSLEVSVTNIIAIERSKDGDGYFLCGSDGGVFAFGDAIYDGNGVGTVVGDVVGFDVKRTGTSGYWLCTNEGYIYAFGGAGYHGGLDGAVDNVTGFSASHTYNGYYLVGDDGGVAVFGDAVHRGDAVGLVLNDPMTDIAVHPSGNGYWLGAEDGGVFTYGPGMAFYGSLPGPWVNLQTVDGNYFDLTEIVLDLMRWSGFWLHDGGVSPQPHGNYEFTGIVSNDEDGKLPEELFDKKPPIDVINTLKSLVGYVFWVGEEGEAHFHSPNWFEPGNFLPDGNHTDVIPEVNEAVQLTQYSVNYSGSPMRSTILIASYQPTENIAGTVITDYTPSNADALRGLIVPFVWVNKVFIKQEEQQVMAELVDLQINMQRRIGAVTMVANPLLQLGDQIRIIERETSETYIHYIRSISSSHDLVTGEYTMQLRTNWLGDEDEWAVYVPSAIVRPSTIQTPVSIGTPTVTV